MGLVFAYAYQHHDAKLLEPVASELLRRGHVLMAGPENYYAFMSAHGNKALLLVADLSTDGHVEGRAAVKLARQNGIGSVSIQHGCPAAFPNPDDPATKTTADEYCLWGPYWERWFDSPHQSVTGNPAMDKRPDIDKKGVALLVPCFREDARHQKLQAMTTEERAYYYIDAAQNLGFDGTWYIRPHPSDMRHQDRVDLIGDMCDELNANPQYPQRVKLYDALSWSEIVMGTSTVVIEGLMFDCKAYPLFMEYLPWPLDREQLFGPQDNQASARIANAVERAMYAAG